MRFAVFLLGGSDFGIEVFVDVNQVAETAYAQTEVVKTGSLVVGGDAFSGFFEASSAEEEQVAEVEVVAERAELIVDNGYIGFLTIYYAIRVGVEHSSLGVSGETHQTVESEVTGYQGVVFGIQEDEIRVGNLGNFFHS